jgi:HEAT repeat protein
MPTFYCWHCYGEVAARQQVCPRCGLSAEAPEGTDYTERLIWALHHPLPDRRLLAAQTLGPRGDTAAIAPLRELTADPDPYVAAAALTSLVAVAGLRTNADLVHHLAAAGAAPVRAAARRLLASPTGSCHRAPS